MAEDKLNFLGQRIKCDKQDKQPTKTEQRRDHDRSRHTLYLDKTLVKLIDKAFKETEHEVYPQEVTKADYLESCLKYALDHQDQVKIFLLSALSGT
jgi:hypothetical protein